MTDLRCLCLHLTVVGLTLSGLVDVIASQHNRTTPLPDTCEDGKVPPVCQGDGDGSSQRKAIAEAFNVSQQIDLVFIVCATYDCVGPDGSHSRIKLVNQFIVKLIDFLATSYGVKIEPKSTQVAVVAYNHSTAWPFFNDIDSGAKKIDSCQFKNMTRSLETLPWSVPAKQDCKLADALRLARTSLSRSVRPNAKKIAWAFSDCKFCERSNGNAVATDQEKANSEEVENEANALKSNGVTVFTVGTSPCPQGFFDNVDKEDLLRKRVASPSDGHFACIDSWMNFAFFDSSKNSSTVAVYADRGEGIDSDHCPAESKCRCVCNVVGNSYSCEDTLKPIALRVEIAVAVAVGGTVLIAVVVIIVVVVFFRRGRCCHGCKNGPPPSVPSRIPPPVPPRPPTNMTQVMVPGGTADYENAINVNNDIGEIEIDYEIMECEKNMEGWSSHLVRMKDEWNSLHLGIYSLTEDYFAQTPGFSLSPQEKSKIHEIMANHRHRHLRRSRIARVVTIASTEYTVDGRALSNSSLSAESSDKVLVAVSRDGYICIGVTRLNQGTACQSAVKRVLDDVTRQYQ